LKALRLKKVLGLAIGDRSLLAAEVVAGEPPVLKQLAEFVYPQGMSLDEPATLGAALGDFLRENQFTAKTVIAGIPARWLVVKSKEVPATDPSTLVDLLRMQAEGEFSSELKDLLYDFADGPTESTATTVLLVATQRKRVDDIVAMCEAANLSASVVTPSAIALGLATERAVSKASLVLTVGSGGAELTAFTGQSTSAIRHLRGPSADRPFIGELRRAVSTTPSNGTMREMVLWDNSGLDPQVMAGELGINVRSGDLPVLGVTTPPGASNGDSRKFASAVALGLSAVTDHPPVVDFLHSRLAPVKRQLIPRWAYAAAGAVVLLIGLIIWGYQYVAEQQAELQKLQDQVSLEQPQFATATAFVAKVSFAQAWHGGNPRYLMCLRDLTNAIPDDQHTYATSLVIREVAKMPGSSGNSGGSSGTTPPKTAEIPAISGVLTGKTSDQQRVLTIEDRMKRLPGFTDVKLGSSDTGHGNEVTFTIGFTYLPPVVDVSKTRGTK
jgi:hypothetical protein